MAKTKREIVAKLLGCKPEDFQAFVEREDGSVVVLNARLQKYKFSAETIALNQDPDPPSPKSASAAEDSRQAGAKRARSRAGQEDLPKRTLEALYSAPLPERPDPRPVPEGVAKVVAVHADMPGDAGQNKRNKRSKK